MMKYILLTLLTFSSLFSDHFTRTNPDELRRICHDYQLREDQFNILFPLQHFLSVEPFTCITPVKSGTHLLMKTLSLLTGLSHQGGLKKHQECLIKNTPQSKPYYLIHHFYYKNNIQFEIRSGFKSVSIIRDPRDILVSQCFGLRAEKNSPKYWDHKPIKARLKLLLQNPQFFGAATDLDFQLRSLASLIENKQQVYLARFEYLVGNKGQGKYELQRRELTSLAEFLGAPLRERQLDYLQANLFGDKFGTFRKGQIGGWREYFTDEIKKDFKDKYGKYLIRFGYEKDNNW